MNEIIYQKSYREYKEELDGVLQRTAEGFVQIGYLLKVARDTNILEESGYKSVAEFAEAEYNLDKTQVSRFISINDKFSEGGYSDRLRLEYQGFGWTKLTVMLQLPDAIAEELTPAYTRAEIQDLKEEVEKENRISDLEVMMEEQAEGGTLLEKVITKLGEDEPELFQRIRKKYDRVEKDGFYIEVRYHMLPDEEKIYTVRVRGIGRIMISANEDMVKLINVRSGEKEEHDWGEVAEAWEAIFDGQDEKANWEIMYGRKFPGNDEIAPEQQKTKVTKAKTEAEKENDERKRDRKAGEGRDDKGSREAAGMEPKEDTESDGGVSEAGDYIEQTEIMTGEIVTEDILPKPELTRKRYMDSLNAKEMAFYMAMEYGARRLVPRMLSFPDELGHWLEEIVDTEGKPAAE